MTEFDLKAGRLAAVARAAGLGGVLVGTPPNFSWLTGGRTNRIDMTREPGAGALFVTAEAEVCVLANAIEMPRLVDEALAGLAVTPIEIPWADERARPGWAVDAGRARTGRPVGADWPAPEAVLVDGAIARARVPLVPAEIARLRAFGAEAGRTLGAFCRTLRPGQTEEAVAGAAIAAFAAIGARSHVTLVGADARLPRYRHPVPTALPWRDLVMVATCVERQGLVVALSRFVAAVSPPHAWRARLSATAEVFAALLDATRDGATGATIFTAAETAYARAGARGEEQRHHQGGAIGYRSRDWVAHPASTDSVTLPQTFAWNPSMSGTKIEDTALVTTDGVELITTTPGWPSLPVEVRGRTLAAADVLVL